MLLLLGLAHAAGLDGLPSVVGTEPDAPPEVVQPAGDLDGDGLGDLVIGMPLDDSAGDTAGGVWIVYGPQFSLLDGVTPLGDLAAHLTGHETQDRAGADVAALGDSDADGYDDVAVAAPEATTDQVQGGKVYLLYGGDPYTDQTLEEEAHIVGVESSDRIGTRIYGPGDVDGDGLTDLLIGVPYSNPAGDPGPGWLALLYGRATRIPNEFRLDTDVDATSAGTTADLSFWINYTTSLGGRAAAIIPDTNGDGNPELLVGAPGVDTEIDLTGIEQNIGTVEPPGAVYVFSVPVRESCDGRDNDGDGLVDEGFDRDQDGVANCFDPEVCDHVDNNGDGTVDEGFPTGSDGQPDCTGTEVCDGIDNDADGTRDEGFDNDGDGIANCFDVETPCNGVDDDGDGFIDSPDCPVVEDLVAGVVREYDADGIIAGNYSTATVPWIMTALPDGRVALGIPAANNQAGTVLLYSDVVGTQLIGDADAHWDGTSSSDQAGWGLAAAGGLGGALLAIGEPGFDGGRGRVRLIDEQGDVRTLEGCREDDLAGAHVRAHPGPDPDGEDQSWIGIGAPGAGWYGEGYGYGYVVTAAALARLPEGPCAAGDTVPETDADQDGSPAGEDCDDGVAWRHPGAVEVCGDGVDDDCDGSADESCGPLDQALGACGCATGTPAVGLAGLGLVVLALTRRRT